MVNKKGLLRIVEASIAIIIVLTVLILVSVNKSVQVEPDISDFLNPIIKELGENPTFREKVFADEVQAIEDARAFLSARIRSESYNFDVRICSDIQDICAVSVFPSDIEGNIFSEERIISPVLRASSDTKKLKIYLWRVG